MSESIIPVRFILHPGWGAVLTDDWRVHVIDRDPRNRGVWFVGGFPYDGGGNPLHENAPTIEAIWDMAKGGPPKAAERQLKAAREAYIAMADTFMSGLKIK